MTLINNSESGASVRSKLNNLIISEARKLKGVATLLADTNLTYTAGQDGTVTAGGIVTTEAEGFSYEVAASGATDQHVTTAGGVKLYVLPTDDGAVNVKAFGAVGDGVTDDTAAFQKAHDNNSFVVATGTYQIRGLLVRGSNKHLDFSAAVISNNSTDGTDTFILGSGSNFSASTLKLGTVSNGSAAGHGVKVVGTCRSGFPVWKEFRVANPEKSVIRGYASEGAQLYDWRVVGDFTRGDLGNLHRVPIIDLDAGSGNVIQGNVWRFGFAYGSSYTGGSYAIPFFSITCTSPTLLLKNDVFIDVGEILNGGAVHMERVIGSRIEVSGFDTSTWVGDFVRSLGGRANSYKVLRKAGTRTAFDWGAGAVEPYDLNIDDTGSTIDGSGINSGTGALFVNTSSDIAITSKVNVTTSGTGTVRDISAATSAILAQASVVGSTGLMRASASFGVTSVTRVADGEYDIILDEPLPANHWPVIVTGQTSSAADVDIVGQVIHDTSDLRKFKITMSDAGIKANKNFSFLILRTQNKEV